ncbi:MAG TPA: sigma 54-interacting transcriptional regulator [Candidatus Jeotgalibaca pullicola]|nr:sigma 54-interacting transcriptional regulator [Candidatus Jeotgalibaca pullicola]
MKKSAKDKVFETLIGITHQEEVPSATAADIASVLGISRQNVSHYLTRLMEEGFVDKISGKPVYWKPIKQIMIENSSEGTNSFQNVVGYDGSLREIIQKCISAVRYPPNGLNILINGSTGVGKSFLANQIFKYAKEVGVIGPNAPLSVLNCADYADNPELLSATLFGYKKGAFTGAEKDTKGLLAHADGGYLFLDEIHRLSRENQEKLFLFMDTGKYRPIGENSDWSEATIRFIFATTEKSEDYFLDTFERRIQVMLKIPDFRERPLIEQIEFVQLFFHNEAEILEKDILVTKEVLEILLTHSILGNVGRLKNIIKISCANAYSKRLGSKLVVTIEDLPIESLNQMAREVTFPINDLLISYAQAFSLNKRLFFNLDERLEKIMTQFNDIDSSARTIMLKKEIQSLIPLLDQKVQLTDSQQLKMQLYQKIWQKSVQKKYGLINSYPAAEVSSRIYANIPEYSINLSRVVSSLTKEFPRTAYVCSAFLDHLPALTQKERELLELLLIVTLSDHVDENLQLKGLLLAHGDSTATSIQSVVNQLCGDYVFEAFDMPIESNVLEVVQLTKQFVNNQVNTNGLILIVDMGSLNQIYTKIKSDLKGELLILNNLTTSIALDIGLKMTTNVPFNRISEDAVGRYSVNVQYFEGFSPKKNIIISCMSGLGISNKLKDVFSEYLSEDTIEVFVKEYRELRELISQNDEKFFDNTKLVITTSDLPKSFLIPNINIYDILEGEESDRLEQILQDELTHQEYLELIQELVKFFSIEGVVSRLNFLNPAIVISEVETAISKYENYYQFTLNGRIKLNLYMHTALMMERLFLSRTEKSEDPTHELSPTEEEFYYVSRSIFQPLEMKYNLKVNAYELSLLYELLRTFLKK